MLTSELGRELQWSECGAALGETHGDGWRAACRRRACGDGERYSAPCRRDRVIPGWPGPSGGRKGCPSPHVLGHLEPATHRRVRLATGFTNIRVGTMGWPVRTAAWQKTETMALGGAFLDMTPEHRPRKGGVGALRRHRIRPVALKKWRDHPRRGSIRGQHLTGPRSPGHRNLSCWAAAQLRSGQSLSRHFCREDAYI